MSKKLTLKSFSLSLCVFVLLQSLIFSGAAIAIPLKVEPFFGDPTVRQLLQEGKFREVRDMAQSRLRDTPRDGDMLAILGYAQAGLGDWENARQNVERAIQLAPANRRNDLRVLLAEIVLGAGDASEAERMLSEIVAGDPKNTRALLGLGFLYRRTDDVSRAEDLFKNVLGIDQQQEPALKALLQIYLSRGDYAEVARLARQIPATAPTKWLGYYFEALVLVRQDQPDYNAAADLLKKSLEISVPTPQVLSTFGYVLIKQQRVQEAVRYLTQAVQLAPDSYDAQHLLGRGLLELKQPQLAAEHLEQAVAIKESPELRQLLARAYLSQGRSEKGLAELMSSLENTGQLTDSQSALQGLYRYTSGDFVQSEEALRQALEKTPDAQHLRFLLIAALLQQERFEGAAREARKALSIYPDQSVLLLNLLAMAELGSRAYEQAESTLRQALAHDSGSTTTRINLSTVYFRQGLFAKAEQELKAVLTRDPGNLEITVRLARVYQAASNYPEAERVLRAALQTAPNRSLLRELVFLKIRERNHGAALELASTMVTQYPALFEGYLFQAQALAALGREADARDALNAGFYAAGETQGSLAVAASLARVHGWHELAVDYLQRYNRQFRLDDSKLLKLYAVELIEVGKTSKAREIIHNNLGATDADALFLLARTYLVDGDRVRAENYIDAALEAGVSPAVIEKQRAELRLSIRTEILEKDLRAEPDNVVRYRALADANEFVGNFDAAIAVYEDGIGKAGNDISFELQIARLLLRKHDTQRAIEVASRVVNSPETGDEARLRAYGVIGMSWAQQRDMAKAEQALENATSEGSRLASAFYELARIKLAKGDSREAIGLLKTAIDIEPNSLRYYLALTALHQRSGNIQESIAVYEDGLSRNPKSVPLLNNVALVYLRQGENDKALASASTALQLAPDDANVLDTLGWIHVQVQDPKSAIRYLERAVDQEPESPLYRYHLGVGYFEAGSVELAKLELEKSLDRRNNAPWAPEIRRVLKAIGES